MEGTVLIWAHWILQTAGILQTQRIAQLLELCVAPRVDRRQLALPTSHQVRESFLVLEVYRRSTEDRTPNQRFAICWRKCMEWHKE